MKKERYIRQRTSKKRGKYLQVVIRRDGIDKTSYGIFYFDDYPTPGVCLEAARQCRDNALRDIKYNKVVTVTLTVDGAYQQFQELLVHTVTTRKRHDAVYRLLIPESLRKKNIVDVTTVDVQRTVNEFAKTHTTEYTKRAMVIWRGIYKAAFMNDIPLVDRSAMVIVPKSRVVPNKRKPSCTQEELDKFLEVLMRYGEGNIVAMRRREDVYYLITIMRYLGLRPQEALALYEDDIDLDNNTVHVHRSIGSNSDSTRVVVSPKTEKSDRILPIPSDLRPILERLVSTHDTTPLLTDFDGLPYSIDVLTGFMNDVSRKDGCPKVTLYMMRHMFSTYMLKLTNNNSKLVQTMMGHEDASMTLHYADSASLEDMENALEKLKFS